MLEKHTPVQTKSVPSGFKDFLNALLSTCSVITLSGHKCSFVFILCDTFLHVRGKLGKGEHLLGLINATYMHDLKCLVYNHKEQVLSTTKLQTFIDEIHSPGTYGLEKKTTASAIALAVSDNCELIKMC